jgi:putative transposase
VKVAWIKNHRTEFPVDSMCRLMRVSRSAYYAWLHRTPTTGEKNDAELTDMIQILFAKSRATSGTRRLKIALSRRDRAVSRRRIGRLMRTAGLAGKTQRTFKATTNSQPNQPMAPNPLDRQFTVEQANQAYVGDVTPIHTQDGWLYLAVVIDLFSRQVVGWSMAEHLRAKLVNDALLMAIWQRKPDKGLLWHTDRGSQ